MEAKAPTQARHRVLSLRERVADAEPRDGIRRGAVTGAELRDVFGAPWHSIELVCQDAGTTSDPSTISDGDLLLFVLSGEGQAEFTSGPLDLRPGTSVAVLKDETYSITAGSEADLEYFSAEMGLPEPE